MAGLAEVGKVRVEHRSGCSTSEILRNFTTKWQSRDINLVHFSSNIFRIIYHPDTERNGPKTDNNIGNIIIVQSDK